MSLTDIDTIVHQATAALSRIPQQQLQGQPSQRDVLKAERRASSIRHLADTVASLTASFGTGESKIERQLQEERSLAAERLRVARVEHARHTEIAEGIVQVEHIHKHTKRARARLAAHLGGIQ